MIKYTYITAPFWHEDYDIRHLRYRCVTQTAGKLIETGESIFSPITHSYMFKLKGNLDKWSHDDMLNFDKAILENASKIYILTLPGWKESKGVNMELVFAASCKPPKEIVYLNPEKYISDYLYSYLLQTHKAIY